MSESNIHEPLPVGSLLKSKLRSYKVEAVLGGGGFGITYKVSSVIMVDKVPVLTFFAVKEHFLKGCYRAGDGTTVLAPPSMRTDMEESRKDFIAEARRLNRLSGLSHNIVRVNEEFEYNNTAYYVMQFLDGGSLSDYLDRDGAMSEAKTLSVIVPVAKAVQLIHNERLLHLDIKPDNIVMMTSQTDGSIYPVLIDFGIAKHFSPSGKPTSTHSAKGASDGYAPIEQYGSIDFFMPELDVYALGATFLHLISGRIPRNAFDITEADINAQIPATVTKATRYAIVNAMKKLREHRTRNISEFLDSLQGEYALSVGYVLNSPSFSYRITGVKTEMVGYIVYRAVANVNPEGERESAHEEKNSAEGIKNVTPYLRGAGKTRRIGKRQMAIEQETGSFEIYELFEKGNSGREADGSVLGFSDGAEHKFLQLVRSRTPKQSDQRYVPEGMPLSEAFQANNTRYFACLMIEKPSVWRRGIQGMRSGASTMARQLATSLGSVASASVAFFRKAAKPAAFAIGLVVMAGLYVGVSELIKKMGNSGQSSTDSTLVAQMVSDSDTMPAPTEEETVTNDTTLAVTNPADIGTSPEVEPITPIREQPGTKETTKPQTDDEKFAEASNANDYTTILSMASKGYAKAYYAAACYYFERKDYANAKNYANKAVNANSNRSLAKTLLTQIDNVTNKHDQIVTVEETNDEKYAKASRNNDYATLISLANSGYAKAYYDVAKYYYDRKDYAKAKSYAQKAVNANVSRSSAQSLLSQIAAATEVKETDDQKYAKAVKNGDYSTLITLAKNGYAKAYYDVAKYYYGRGDYSNAETYAFAAVNVNVNKSQANDLLHDILMKTNPLYRGSCYAQGTGVAKNYKLAFEAYMESASSGNAQGLREVGICYEIGRGVGRNPTKALEYYEKAEAKGANCQEDIKRLKRTNY